MGKWKRYYKKPRGRQHSKLLEKAVQFVKKRKNALDIGCGAGQECKFLLDLGFTVTGIDKDDGVKDFIPKEVLKDRRFNLIINRIEDIDLRKASFDLNQC